jgi:hypothetical protein
MLVAHAERAHLARAEPKNRLPIDLVIAYP